MGIFIDIAHNSNTWYVLIGCLLIAISSSLVGTFTFLQKKSLIGDTIAHAVLPGVALSFFIGESKDPFILFPGAFITGWLAIVLVNTIKNNSKLKQDAAISIVLTMFFGFGIWLLTIIQHSNIANQSGLDNFIFGKAAALSSSDVKVFAVVTLVIFLCIYLAFKEFKLLSFDRDYSKSIGLPVAWLEFVLSSITVLCIVVGIQAVGVVLMASLLIAPPATARFWTNKLSYMIWIAILISSISAITGAFISYSAFNMPTGPWIVLVLSFIALLSFIFSPHKGMIYKWYKQRAIRIQMLEENLLKTFYYLYMKNSANHNVFSKEDLLKQRPTSDKELMNGLNMLINHGYIEKSHQMYFSITKEGLNKGKHIAHLHKLWEVYLTKYLRIAPDHVHDDAENIEHILTPELQAHLEKIIDLPETVIE